MSEAIIKRFGFLGCFIAGLPKTGDTMAWRQEIFKYSTGISYLFFQINFMFANNRQQTISLFRKTGKLNYWNA